MTGAAGAAAITARGRLDLPLLAVLDVVERITDDLILAGTAVDEVACTVFGHDEIRAPAADHRIAAGTAGEPVLTGAAEEHVARRAAFHEVVAVAPYENVCSTPSVHPVVACEPVELVGLRGSPDDVSGRGTDHRRSVHRSGEHESEDGPEECDAAACSHRGRQNEGFD